MGKTKIDVGHSIAIDDSGNVYTTGDFCGTIDFDPGPVTYNLTSAGDSDIFISKLDVNGNFVWAKKMGGISSDDGHSVTVDDSGNVYATGFFMGTVDFDPGPGIFNLTSAGSIDIFISKLDANGNFVWAKQMGGISSDIGNSIAIDGSGNVYTTGSFSGTADFDPGPNTFNLTSAGEFNIFISKLDSLGNFIWAKQINGPGDISYSVKTDVLGNVYTTGNYWGTADFDPGIDTFNLTSAGGYDIFIIKLSRVYCNMYATSSLITNESSFGANDGAIEISVNNGTPPYTYNWSNSATTQNISGLSAGYYSVSVTDSNSCSTTATFEVLNEQTIWDCNDTLISLFLNPIDTCFDVEPDIGYIYSFSFPSDSTVEITWLLLSSTDTSFTGYLTELYQFDSIGCFVALLDIECAKYLKHFSGNIHIYSVITDINKPTYITKNCNIYPNPATGNITISLQNTDISKATAEIYDMQGKKYISREINDQNTEINISALAKGIYFIKLTGQGFTKVEKIIKY